MAINPPRPCSMDDCTKNVVAKELCSMHYQRTRKGIPAAAPVRQFSDTGVCAQAACGRAVHSGGLCPTHYYRSRKGLDMEAPIRDWTRVTGEACAVEDCDRQSENDALCHTHYNRRRVGEQDWDRPIKAKAEDGTGHTDKNGYRVIRVNGRITREHIHEFEKVYGRPVRTKLPHGETVHHKNGNRSDNRTDGPPHMTAAGKLLSGNLELWSSRQPRGQEIGPKLDWAAEMIADYAAYSDDARWDALEAAYAAAKAQRAATGRMTA